jgi:hypothetical protein
MSKSTKFQVVLDDETADRLEAMSAALRIPKSTLIASLVGGALDTPDLLQAWMTAAFRRMKQERNELIDEWAERGAPVEDLNAMGRGEIDPEKYDPRTGGDS